MNSEIRANALNEAIQQLTVSVESEPRLMSEPLNVIISSIIDLLEVVKDANNGFDYDSMRALIAIGQIGTQTTKAPEFWKITK